MAADGPARPGLPNRRSGRRLDGHRPCHRYLHQLAAGRQAHPPVHPGVEQLDHHPGLLPEPLPRQERHPDGAVGHRDHCILHPVHGVGLCRLRQAVCQLPGRRLLLGHGHLGHRHCRLHRDRRLPGCVHDRLCPVHHHDHGAAAGPGLWHLHGRRHRRRRAECPVAARLSQHDADPRPGDGHSVVLRSAQQLFHAVLGPGLFWHAAHPAALHGH